MSTPNHAETLLTTHLALLETMGAPKLALPVIGEQLADAIKTSPFAGIPLHEAAGIVLAGNHSSFVPDARGENVSLARG